MEIYRLLKIRVYDKIPFINFHSPPVRFAYLPLSTRREGESPDFGVSSVERLRGFGVSGKILKPIPILIKNRH
jgi:hypothetical protein